MNLEPDAQGFELDILLTKSFWVLFYDTLYKFLRQGR